VLKELEEIEAEARLSELERSFCGGMDPVVFRQFMDLKHTVSCMMQRQQWLENAVLTLYSERAEANAKRKTKEG
jgi:hypothetical protein